MMEQAVNKAKFRLSTAVFFFITLIGALACNAATLYEHSLAAFEANAQKASQQSFTFVVLGDSKDSDYIFEKSLKEAAAYNPIFILHEGDVSEKGTVREIDHFLEIVQRTVPKIPLFIVPGNHEQKAIFTQKIGPLNFSITNARLGLKIIALDDSTYALNPEQLKYLEEQLDGKQKVTFVTMHIPPITQRWTWHAFSKGAPEFMDLVGKKKVTGVFYGHIHMYDREDIGGVPHIVTGGAGASLTRIGFQGDPSYHIIVVKVEEGRVTFNKVEIEE